jgi:hypothetical protein
MSWKPKNLGVLGDRPKTKPTLGSVGIFYPGKRHVLSGPQEAAKTIAAYAAALGVAREGGVAIVIDFEMGEYDARDRFRDMGATDEDFSRIRFIEPDEPLTDAIVTELLAHDPALVIIDAAAGAYDLQGLDDNKRSDVERFGGIYVKPFWKEGAATLVNDHVVKQAKARGSYAIGSERKVGGVDVHLGFEGLQPLRRGGTGLIKITTHKDRPAHLHRPRAALLHLRSDPDTHAISWAFELGGSGESDDTASGGFRPTVLMERVSIFLEHAREPTSRTKLEEGVKGKTEYIRVAVDRLIEEGYAREHEGPRRARLVELVSPFREDDPAPTPPRPAGATPPPTPPLAGARIQAENTTPPDPAPTPPLTPPSTPPPGALSPLGERQGGAGSSEDEDEVERLLRKHADIANGNGYHAPSGRLEPVAAATFLGDDEEPEPWPS